MNDNHALAWKSTCYMLCHV